MTRTAGAPIGCQRPSRFWGLGCPKIFHEAEDTLDVIASITGVDALLLECNHDVQMLQNGPYPPRLQERVGGNYGHLSNDQAARILAQIDHGRLQHLVIGHVSEKNNSPDLARRTLAGVCESLDARLSVLEQGNVSGWFCMNPD
ncbi:hypothetical protein [Thiolapillus sp.]|uniref:hypothetical protein n=1 Tax=Thiolapillus sp. TaxID=2017437 RepID=UPI0026005557|nr:hypothetical protein [Thiolapillus sp.]